MAKKFKFARGTFLEAEMYESRAFYKLKGAAQYLLIQFYGKRKFDQMQNKPGKRMEPVVKNHDSITFTYAEALEKHGIGKSQFTRAIDELLAKGFITVIRQGGAYDHDKTVYGLSEKWRDWKPGIVFEVRKPDKIQRGFRKPKKQK